MSNQLEADQGSTVRKRRGNQALVEARTDYWVSSLVLAFCFPSQPVAKTSLMSPFLGDPGGSSSSRKAPQVDREQLLV